MANDRRMLRRSSQPESPDIGCFSLGDHVENVAKLRDALDGAVKALQDPEIEARVREYFETNPSFSRDALHVAAVACRFRSQKLNAGDPERASESATRTSQRP